MSDPVIKITITTADKKLSEGITEAVKLGRPGKYVHSRMMLARLRMVKWEVRELPEVDQIARMRNALTIERNIAAFAADQYAEIGEDIIFNDLTELVNEIDDILKA